MISPLEQFEVTPIKGVFYFFEYTGLSVTNYTIFLGFLLLILIVLFSLNSFALRVIPSIGQICIESIYNFVFSIVATNLEFKSYLYFPYVFTIFIFVLSANLLGLFPYSFTVTSQIALTLFLSLSTFIGLIWVGIEKHKVNFLGLFFPPEAPALLAFLLVPIEMVSFFSRPFSLAIRLFANMTAGHVLLKILTGFSLVLMSAASGFVPLVFSVVKNIVIGPEILYSITKVGTCNSFFSFSFFECCYQVYDYATIYVGISDYFNRLLSFEDITYNTDDSFGGIQNWHMAFAWKHMVALNYISPVFGLWPNRLDRGLYLDFISLITIRSPRRHSSALFARANLFYLYKPLVFPAILYSTYWLYFNFVGFSSAVFSVSLQPIVYVLQIVISFIVSCFAFFLPIVLLCFFITLELFVSILQAYVFTILLVIYLRDVTELH